MPTGQYTVLITSAYAQGYDLESQSGDIYYHAPDLGTVTAQPQCFEDAAAQKKSTEGEEMRVTTRLHIRLPAGPLPSLIVVSTDSPTARVVGGELFAPIDKGSRVFEWDVEILPPRSTHRIAIGINGITDPQDPGLPSRFFPKFK